MVMPSASVNPKMCNAGVLENPSIPKDKIVLIGSTAPGMQDVRATPVAGTFPGVEMHANLLVAMLDAGLSHFCGHTNVDHAVNGASDADPLGALAAVGGFEHAAMAGFVLGGAALRLPVIVDGVIAEIGDARGRFPTADSLACLAGVAPSTRQSGKVRSFLYRLFLCIIDTKFIQDLL